MKRCLLLSLLCAFALLLTGCRDFFEAEYVVESSFEPPRPAAESEVRQTSIASFEELRRVLLDMVAEGETERRFVFAADYPGNLSDDLAAACWQVRTQDALSAYCVETLAYELSRVVSGIECSVTVSYSKAAGDVENIVHLPYAADARDVLCDAMRSGRERLVLLIERSSYSEEEMAQLVLELYLESPSLSPREPSVTVKLFSGAETQRLYELSFDYGMEAEELAAQKAALAALKPFEGIDTAALSEAERAMLACSYLCVNTRMEEASDKSSIYDVLVAGEGDSLDLACAYVELCRSLNLNCQTVIGQRNWEEHSWNLVELDGDWYQVDVAGCLEQGMRACFLMDDVRAWERYRWDYFSYPHCEGSLRFEDVDALWQSREASMTGA